MPGGLAVAGDFLLLGAQGVWGVASCPMVNVCRAPCTPARLRMCIFHMYRLCVCGADPAVELEAGPEGREGAG